MIIRDVQAWPKEVIVMKATAAPVVLGFLALILVSYYTIVLFQTALYGAT